MHAGITVSYKTIVDKLLRDFPFDEKVDNEQVIEWLAEFMAHTNAGITMESKVAYISIIDGRGDLPVDLYKIKQAAELSGALTLQDAECGKGRLIPMRWSTDNFHMRYHMDNRDYTTQANSTYTVGQGVIFPSFGCGVVALSYEGIPLDCEGFPMIPGEQQWLEAAAHYLAHRIARKMWLRNEITSEKYFAIERDKEWYFAQAVNHAKQFNGVDDAESFKNQMVRTIPSIQDHTSFFANMQLPEQRFFRNKIGTSVGNGLGSVTITTPPNGIPSFTSGNQQVEYLPILITGTATSITNTTASSICQVTSMGNTPITNHGICYSTSANPMIADSIISLGTLVAPGQFTCSLTGLLPNTTYHARAYATHTSGTSYGNEITFVTLP